VTELCRIVGVGKFAARTWRKRESIAFGMRSVARLIWSQCELARTIVFDMEPPVFVEWLIRSRGLTQKAASDALSRCRRVEKMLNIHLKEATSSQKSFNKVLERLRQQTKRNDLAYSLRLYAQFENPKIDLRKYAFYGDSSRMGKRK
jgi:hypothetical protein